MSYEADMFEVVGEASLRETGAVSSSFLWLRIEYLIHDHATESFKVYEMEEDVTKDLAEFSIANAVYSALVEGHAAEISSRYVLT